MTANAFYRRSTRRQPDGHGMDFAAKPVDPDTLFEILLRAACLPMDGTTKTDAVPLARTNERQSNDTTYPAMPPLAQREIDVAPLEFALYAAPLYVDRIRSNAETLRISRVRI